MRLTTKISWLLLLFCHLYTPHLLGQPVVNDTLPADGYGGPLGVYHAYLTPEPALFRGPEYLAYDRTLRNGHPYYGENSRREGTIYYSGIFYNHVFLLYDIVRDQPVMNDPFNIFKIELIRERVDSFTIENHFFLHLTDSLNPTQPRNGYYERLYKGGIVLLKRERKVIQQDLYSSDHVEQFIDGTDSSYYLKMGNEYHSVNNTRSLLNVLKDRKKEVRKFIRTNELDMRKDRENTLIKVTAWYDSSVK